MIEFLADYGLFLAKTLTIVAAVAAIIILSVSASRRGHRHDGLTIEKLNDKYREMTHSLRHAMLPKAEWRREQKEEKQRRKQEQKHKGQDRRRVYVLDFKGDIRATAVAALREEISAIVTVARAGDEVVLRLENFGGAVHEHGLAASQLRRLREREIPLTVLVDKGAASGGYLMACVANRIVAAPFAVIGSIGVIAQLPNFHRLLDSRGVDFEQITAGRYKRTVTMFGRNTEEDRAKLKEELEEVHTLFKQAIVVHRPGLDLERIATGEHWYGVRALELGLIDGIGASDDHLLTLARDADLYHLAWKARPTLQQRLLTAVRAAADGAAEWLAERSQESRLP